MLIGIVAFFVLEKLALWRHHHAHGANAAKPPERAALLILVGDGVHNFVDGVLIAAAFLTDTSLGIVTTLAVIAHEIPQEVGDFMLLLNAGLSRTRALLLNLVASLTAVAGGLAGYLLFDAATAALPYVLALAAASFIYVAVADLIPDLNRQDSHTPAVALIDDRQEQIVEMDNGCICCTVHGDLVRILGDLSARRRAVEVAFDRVIIETTGLADPAPVAQTFFVDKTVRCDYLLDAIITVADAKHGGPGPQAKLGRAEWYSSDASFRTSYSAPGWRCTFGMRRITHEPTEATLCW